MILQELAERLRSTGSGSLIALRCDLRVEEEILEVFEHIRKDHGGVDVLINNAASTAYSSLLAGDTSKWKSIFDVSVFSEHHQ